MERSTEQVTAGRVVISQIEDFLPQDGFSFESLLDTQMVNTEIWNVWRVFCEVEY